MDDIDASVVKILGPKETSVEVKGFNWRLKGSQN
jgi:hypothetical protein